MLDYIPASYPLAVKCTRAALPTYVKSLYGFKSDVNWFEYNEDALAVAFRKVVRGEAGVLGLDKMSEAFSDDAVTAAIG